MKKFLVPRILFALTVLVTVLLVAACRGTNPTSTPVPPTVNVPTPLPPAPTAPPLTEAPTAVVPTEVVPAAATETPVVAASATATTAAPEPTNTTASSTTTKSTSPTRSTTGGKTTGGGAPPPQQGPLQGLYVAGIRYDPTFPRNNDPLTFYVTVVNRNARDQNYPICVEIFRPDAAKSFGITNCDTVNLPVGTHEVLAGNWIGSGIKDCIPLRARAVLHELDTDNVRLPMITLTGGALWKDFTICP